MAQTYKITAPDGRVVRVTGDSPPSEQEAEEIFSSIKPAAPVAEAQPAAPVPPPAPITPESTLANAVKSSGDLVNFVVETSKPRPAPQPEVTLDSLVEQGYKLAGQKGLAVEMVDAATGTKTTQILQGPQASQALRKQSGVVKGLDALMACLNGR